jgi:hypothetical protein
MVNLEVSVRARMVTLKVSVRRDGWFEGFCMQGWLV